MPERNSVHTVRILPEDLTRESFEAWLRALPETYVFEIKAGYRCKTCPLAAFIGGDVTVVNDGYWYPDQSDSYLLPDWAISFIDCFDRHLEASRAAAIEALADDRSNET